MVKQGFNQYSLNAHRRANQQSPQLVNDYGNCVDNIIQNKLTDEEREWYYAEKQKQKDSTQLLIQDCRAKYIGQLDEMNDCIYSAERAYLYNP